MKKKQINPFEYAGQILTALEDGILLTTKSGDKVNTMTIAWGTLGIEWNRPIFITMVREHRYSRTMLDENPDNWFAWSSMGDVRVKQCRYEEAIGHYKKAAELEPAPRYIDNWDSIGQINEMLGRWGDAAAAYERVLDIYREDWKETDGFWVEQVQTKILKCKAKMA